MHELVTAYFGYCLFTLKGSLLKYSYLVCSGSLFTNSNWFAFEDNKAATERPTGSLTSPAPNTEETVADNGGGESGGVAKDDDLDDTATSTTVVEAKSGETDAGNVPGTSQETGPDATEKPAVWVEWRETPDTSDPSEAGGTPPSGKPEEDQGGGKEENTSEPSPPAPEKVEAESQPTSSDAAEKQDYESESGNVNPIPERETSERTPEDKEEKKENEN